MGDVVLSLKNILMNTSNINSCMKALNLDTSSSFLCFVKLLEDAVLDYPKYDDYSYLMKVSNYLERVYKKLSIKEQQGYRQTLSKIRKIYKKQSQSLIKGEREYFEKVYVKLGILLTCEKDKKENIETNSNGYDILHEIIFKFQNLEYLDDFLKRDSNILNSKKDDRPIFVDIISEYLNRVINNDSKGIEYFERVINKFLREETFDLFDQMRDDIINTLTTFMQKKKNLQTVRQVEIKKIIEAILGKKTIYDIFNINRNTLELTNDEMDMLKVDTNSKRILLNDYIITIDDFSSTVLDDGLSKVERLPSGNLLFKVHIASPLDTFSYYSRIIDDAKIKTSTIYFKDNNIPMLPPILSSDKLSLNEGEYRYAKTFCFEFDKFGNIVNYKFLNTIIKVSKKMSYDSLNEMYKSGGKDIDDEKMLYDYDLILSSLKRMFKNAKVYEEIKRENIIGHSQKIKSFSESLVSYSMILTGYIVAMYFHDNNLPYAYRCHNFDKEWQEFLNSYMEDGSSFNKKMLKDIKGSFPRSYYSRENKGHMGLDLDYYSHITSPLRRFCDILNMHALNLCYFKSPSDKEIYSLEKEIDKVCRYINMQSNTIDEYLMTDFDKVLKK